MTTPAELGAALAGRYTLENEIGRGGMATVYLARDLRHDRRVAVKVLNPELGAVLGIDRFLAEIKVTANLQHPNLLPLFDSGEAAGLLYYVMPFVEGESLRITLNREKQLPVDEAVRIAVAIANALEYAHSHGVIHRDLKPENILLQSGQPVVADFGIALAVSRAGGTRVTQTGLSLGTPQYMSPEQATGDRVIDGRSDIYSLAAVTYEMLAGEPPLPGGTAQAIVARLLTETPRPIRSIRSTVPESVEAALAQALEKLPADRMATAREFADALSGRTQTRPVRRAAPAASSQRTRVALWTSWVVAVAAVASSIWGWTRDIETPNQVVRYTVGLRRGQSLGTPLFGATATMAISPDGRNIVYSVADSIGSHLEIRAIDELTGRFIPGSSGAAMPEFSPDGKWVAFESNDGKLQKVALAGGEPVTLCELPRTSGIAWVTEDMIVFSPRAGSVDRAMWQVSASGGEPAKFTDPDSAGFAVQMAPRAAADGRYVLYVALNSTSADGRIGIASVPNGKTRIAGTLAATYILGYVDGRVIYVRGDGRVLAAPLDLETASAGEPVPLMDSVAVALSFATAALSRSGSLTYVRGSGRSVVSLVDERGVARPLLTEERSYLHPMVSPDGRRMALTISTATGSDIWVYDLRSRTLERAAAQGTSDRASWTPDGRRLVYTSNRNGQHFGIWWQPADASDQAEMLFEGPVIIREAVVTPDGKGVVFREDTPDRARDLRYLSLADRKPGPLLSGIADELMPRVSPDGRWLAYISDESGNYEVYVRPFPGPGGRMAVSTGGGMEPVWSPDGRRLFYRSGTRLMVANVTTTPGFAVTQRSVLFDSPYAGHPYHQNYDVMPDGRTFVMLQPAGSEGRQIVVVLNWMDEVRRILASQR